LRFPFELQLQLQNLAASLAAASLAAAACIPDLIRSSLSLTPACSTEEYFFCKFSFSSFWI
jgi:hypothetical protein